MKHTQAQLDEIWDAINKPENRKKAKEAEDAGIPAPKVITDDAVAQVMSMPSDQKAATLDIYGRRPGGPWVEIP